MATSSSLLRICAVGAVLLAYAAPGYSRQTAYDRALPSVVWIVTADGTGSGVLVDKERKLVLTSFHVVKANKEVLVCFPERKEGKPIAERDYYRNRLKEIGIKASVKSQDPKRDLALLELESVPAGASALSIADRGPTPGQRVYSIGNPGASGAQFVCTSGTVRQVYEKRLPMCGEYLVVARVIETQSPVNPGDSGGPMFNEDGALIGIVDSFQSGVRLVSHGIDLDEIKQFLRGEIKSVDSRVRDSLNKAKIPYRLTPYGVFVIQCRDPKGDTSFTVCVSSKTEEFKSLEIRELWSVVHVSERPLCQELANQLLLLNAQYKIGKWEQSIRDNKHFVSFKVEIPANCTYDALKSAVDGTASVVSDTKKEVARLAAIGGIDPQTLIGRWEAEISEGDGSLRRFSIELCEDETFVWQEQAITIRGTYELAAGVIRAKIHGNDVRLGTILRVDQRRLVMQLRDKEVLFIRLEAKGGKATAQQQVPVSPSPGA